MYDDYTDKFDPEIVVINVEVKIADDKLNEVLKVNVT